MGSNRFVLRVIAIVMVITVLCSIMIVPVSASAVVDDILIDIVWETLKGWGITLLEDGYNEISENLRQWLSGEIEEYVISELNEAFSSWVNGIDWIYDNYGRRVVNALGLDKFYLFAKWLQVKYGYTDNQIVRVNYNYDLNGLVAYSLPVELHRSTSSQSYEVDIITSNDNVGAIYTYRGGSSKTVGYIFVSNQPATLNKISVSNNGTITQNSIQLTKNTYKGYTMYIYMNDAGVWYPVSSTTEPNYTRYDEEVVLQVLSTEGVYLNSGGTRVQIASTSIEYPIDSSEYQEGYSIIYYPDGSIGYLDVAWPDSVSVDNLPAIIARNDIQNPGISSVWHYVTDSIDNFDDGVNLMRGVIYSVVPSPYLLLAYASLVLLLVFGLIKVARK